MNMSSYKPCEEDIENVLFSNKDRLLYTTDVSLSQLANELFSILDFENVNRPVSTDEVCTQLTKLGVFSEREVLYGPPVTNDYPVSNTHT